MSQIKKCFTAYNTLRDGERATPEVEKSREAFMELLEEVLTRKEYIEIEAAINDYCDVVEETAFTGGFKFATKLLTEAMGHVM